MDTITEPIPPHSAEAEKALLGSALIDPDVIITANTSPDDFYVHRHRFVWVAMLELVKQGITPDFVTLSDALQKSGKYEDIGGARFLSGLITSTPTSLHSDGYAKLVKESARRRVAIRAATDLIKAAYDPDTDLDIELAKAYDRLRLGSSSNSSVMHISELVSLVYDEVEARSRNPVDTWGLKTGLIDVDTYTGGFEPGTIIQVCGEPGIGKSIMVDQWGVNFADKCESPGVIFSLEMSGKQVVRRSLSGISRVGTRGLKSGNLDADEWGAFVLAVEKLGGLPIFIKDIPGLTVSQLDAELARLVTVHGAKWFILDYLLLMGGYEKIDNETDRSAMLSKGVTECAKRYGLVGVVVNSGTKGLMDNAAPSNRDMRGSGQLSHDADIVCFLTKHRPGKGQQPDQRLATLTFTKGRDFDMGLFAVDLVKHKGFPGFSDVVRTVDKGNARSSWSDV